MGQGSVPPDAGAGGEAKRAAGRRLAYVSTDGRYRALFAEALAPLGYTDLSYFAGFEDARTSVAADPGRYRIVLLHEPLKDRRPADELVAALREASDLAIVVLGESPRWQDGSWEDVALVRPPVTGAAVVKAVAALRETSYSSLVQRLIQTPGFDTFSEEALAFLLSKARAVQVPEGRVLFEPGASGEGMYFVLAGQVALLVGGREVERVGGGGFFGELAMLEGRPRTARAVTLGTTVLLEVTSEILDHADAEFRAVLFELLTRTLCRRLRRTNTLVEMPAVRV